jgi:hypothetical protein
MKTYKTDKEALEFRKSMHVDHYTLAYRLANRKLTAIAGVSFEGRTCLRAAELSFQKEGFSTCGAYSVYYTNHLIGQKKYAGKSPVYQEL